MTDHNAVLKAEYDRIVESLGHNLGLLALLGWMLVKAAEEELANRDPARRMN